MWFVYLLECNNGYFYCGVTNDLEKRFEKHRSGRGSKYTRAFGVKRFVYHEGFSDKSLAMVREAEIKKMKRKSKLELVQNFEKK